jgi:taurine dioxygenase
MRLHPTGKFDNRAAHYKHIEARPLAAAMGAEILGVDAARMSDEQFDAVRHALYRHKMIYLRKQKLTHADHESFSLRFGSFAEDAYTQGIPGHLNVHPLIKEEPDMLAMWDNRLCVHQAYNDYQGYRREMYRTTIQGEKPA